MTREFFIAIDPITSVHMGLCNAPDTIHRAKALAQAIRDRHQEFVEDEDNFPEYAAMHYLDPSVKKTAEMKGLGTVASFLCRCDCLAVCVTVCRSARGR
jgi:hypothetical protein